MAKKKRTTSRKNSARKPRKQQKKKSTRCNEKVRRLLQQTQLFYKEKRKWEAKAELDKTEAPFSSLEVDISESSHTVSSEFKVIGSDVKKENPSQILEPSEKKMKNLEAPERSEEKTKNLEAPKTSEKKMENLVAPKTSEEKMEKLKLEASKTSEVKIEKLKLDTPKRTDILVEKKETPRQWNCPLCTFLNEPHHLSCSMCRTPNPSGALEKPVNHKLQQELCIDSPKSDERKRRSARRKRQKSERLVKFYTHKLQEDLKSAMEVERKILPEQSKNEAKSIEKLWTTNQKTTMEFKMKNLNAPKKRMTLGTYHQQKAFKMKRKKVFLRMNTTSPRVQVNNWMPKRKIVDRLRKKRLETIESRKQDKIEPLWRPDIDLCGTTDEEEVVSDWSHNNKRNKKRHCSLLK